MVTPKRKFYWISYLKKLYLNDVKLTVSNIKPTVTANLRQGDGAKSKGDEMRRRKKVDEWKVLNM